MGFVSKGRQINVKYAITLRLWALFHLLTVFAVFYTHPFEQMGADLRFQAVALALVGLLIFFRRAEGFSIELGIALGFAPPALYRLIFIEWPGLEGHFQNSIGDVFRSILFHLVISLYFLVVWRRHLRAFLHNRWVSIAIVAGATTLMGWWVHADGVKSLMRMKEVLTSRASAPQFPHVVTSPQSQTPQSSGSTEAEQAIPPSCPMPEREILLVKIAECQCAAEFVPPLSEIYYIPTVPQDLKQAILQTTLTKIGERNYRKGLDLYISQITQECNKRGGDVQACVCKHLSEPLAP
ncbi:hypothetical protein [Magnetofaba australis]|uniref:Uncharacterized protein n=1 Tax=Magnetofaba australis IT-1 TaxID=1434232 RepID=A0A1Y2KAS5_9PROT|nr:hypothetical protein [Magnetofaba australis]OSM07034.1 hypothetical protein MAIT1_00056 [Magnetofaba australis IT-1]